MEYERFLAQRIRNVPPSGIRRFFDILNDMPDVISLGIGEPDFVTPRPIVETGIAALRAGKTGYTGNSGLPELRRAIAEMMAARYGVHYDPDTEVLVTVGVSEALFLAAASFVEAGEEVIIPEPCFVSYGPNIAMVEGVPVYVPTYVEHDFQVTGEVIEQAITPRTKAILIGYPNNPTGAVMTRERLLEIADVIERHDVLVFSDEIYDRLVYGVEHVCFASLPGMRERTIHLGGFSKDYAMTGWRLGYACGPAPLIAAMRKMHQYLIMSAPTLAQYAAMTALTSPDAEADVERMRQAYDRRRRLIVDGLNAIGLPTFEPRGAFYAFPDVRSTGLDSETFSMRLLQEEHVAVVPGGAFGPSGEGFVRCAYATAYEQIEEALNRLDRFVARVKREQRMRIAK